MMTERFTGPHVMAVSWSQRQAAKQEICSWIALCLSIPLAQWGLGFWRVPAKPGRRSAHQTFDSLMGAKFMRSLRHHWPSIVGAVTNIPGIWHAWLAGRPCLCHCPAAPPIATLNLAHTLPLSAVRAGSTRLDLD